jgi:20S proteasome alpha/beta subunit
MWLTPPFLHVMSIFAMVSSIRQFGICMLVGCSLLLPAIAEPVPTRDTHYSFSLTTFDPNGKLDQVERALVAASLGPPIVGVIKSNGNEDCILLASPQILPSPLMSDDGTPRFARVSPHIVLGHTGIAADGRVITEAAQRLAIEHTYTYDEPIPIGIFLEEISLLFQSYTTKQGVRPFGCTLLVAYLPPLSSCDSELSKRPRFFRMDCSGAVEELSGVATINGKTSGDSMKSRLVDLATNTNLKSRREERKLISDILQDAVEDVKSKNKAYKTGNDDDVKFKLPLRIISASFDRNKGLVIERRLAKPGQSNSIGF